MLKTLPVETLSDKSPALEMRRRSCRLALANSTNRKDIPGTTRQQQECRPDFQQHSDQQESQMSSMEVPTCVTDNPKTQDKVFPVERSSKQNEKEEMAAASTGPSPSSRQYYLIVSYKVFYKFATIMEETQLNCDNLLQMLMELYYRSIDSNMGTGLECYGTKLSHKGDAEKTLLTYNTEASITSQDPPMGPDIQAVQENQVPIPHGSANEKNLEVDQETQESGKKVDGEGIWLEPNYQDGKLNAIMSGESVGQTEMSLVPGVKETQLEAPIVDLQTDPSKVVKSGPQQQKMECIPNEIPGDKASTTEMQIDTAGTKGETDGSNDAKINSKEDHPQEGSPTIYYTKDKGGYTCTLCPYQCKRKRYIEEHTRIHTGERPYQCNECEARFKQRHHLRQHLLSHSGLKPYKCDFCLKEFRAKDKLVSHQRTHHKDMAKTEGSGLAKVSSSKKHLNACEQCDYVTAYPGDLVKHRRIHTGEKCFKCELCSFATAWKKNLKDHMIRHSGEKPFSCDQCTYATHDQHNLRTHKLTHNKNKPYICEVCGAAFGQQKFLRQHQVVHTGEKPFQCDKCEYRTGFRSNLRCHMLMHLDRKTYICEQCGKDFRQKGHLISHQKNRHFDPDKIYTCNECGYTVRNSQSFNSHKRKHKPKVKIHPPSKEVSKSGHIILQNIGESMLMNTINSTDCNYLELGNYEANKEPSNEVIPNDINELNIWKVAPPVFGQSPLQPVTTCHLSGNEETTAPIIEPVTNSFSTLPVSGGFAPHPGIHNSE